MLQHWPVPVELADKWLLVLLPSMKDHRSSHRSPLCRKKLKSCWFNFSFHANFNRTRYHFFFVFYFSFFVNFQSYKMLPDIDTTVYSDRTVTIVKIIAFIFNNHSSFIQRSPKKNMWSCWHTFLCHWLFHFVRFVWFLWFTLSFYQPNQLWIVRFGLCRFEMIMFFLKSYTSPVCIAFLRTVDSIFLVLLLIFNKIHTLI